MTNIKYSSFVMEDPWLVPYIYRKVNDNFYCDFDVPNGYYPYDHIDEPVFDDFNIKASLNKDERIKSFHYYKVAENGCCGRPVNHHLALNLKDKKLVTDALDECTESRAEQILTELLNEAKNRTVNGWKLEKISKNYIFFKSIKGEEKRISRKRLMKYIEISHSYLEILYNEDFWLSNTPFLNIDDCDICISIFSLIDETKYYNYQELKEESDERVYRSKASQGIVKLALACKNNDFNEAKKYIKYAKEDMPKSANLESPILYAVVNNNDKLCEMLIKNDADDIGQAIYNVIQANNDSIMEIFIKRNCLKYADERAMELAENKKRYDYLFMLLKQGIAYAPNENVFSLGREKIEYLASFSKVIWKRVHLEYAYEKCDIKIVKKMLKSLETQLKSFNKYEDLQLAARKEALQWIIDIGNLDLLKYFMKLDCLLERNSYEKSLSFCDIELFPKVLSYSRTWAKYIPVYFEKLFGKDDYKNILRQAVVQAVKNKDLENLNKLFEWYRALIDLETLKIIRLHIHLKNKYDNSDEEIIKILINNTKELHAVKAWLEPIISNGSIDLCKYLLKRHPEIEKNPELFNSLIYYILRREPDDFSKNIMEEKSQVALLSLQDLKKSVTLNEKDVETLISLIVRSGDSDSDEFANALKVFRQYEDNSYTWNKYISALVKAYVEDYIKSPNVYINIKYSNKNVISEFKHIEDIMQTKNNNHNLYSRDSLENLIRQIIG